jgi:hypothetical protein
MEAPLWTPSQKIETNVLSYISPFWFITWELNFGQTQVLLGTSWGMHLGIPWELDGNMLGTHWEPGGLKKVPLPAPPQKEKTAPFMRAC